MKRLLCYVTSPLALWQTSSRQISRNIPLCNVSLYTEECLGITSFLNTSKMVRDKYGEKKEVFINKMSEFVKDGPTNMIFTEDLKTMVYTSAGEQDFELIHKMMIKFNNQNKEIRFGKFVFGPIVMRMYSYYNACDEALKVFHDPQLEGFFDQIATYHILCNMLYKNQKYEEVIQMFEYVKSKQVQMAKYPKHVVLLMFAACYKQNTPQSYQYACKVWSDLCEFGHHPIRKAAAFFACLALNQGHANVSLEVVSSLKQQSYVSVRNIKLLAYAELNRTDLAMPVLRSLLDTDLPVITNKTSVFKQSIDKLQSVIEKSDDIQLKKDFSQVVKGLEERDMIENKTMDQFLSQETNLINPNNQTTVNNQLLVNSFRNNRRVPERSSSSSQGLRDMY